MKSFEEMLKEEMEFWKYNRYYFGRYWNLKYLIITKEFFSKLINKINK